MTSLYYSRIWYVIGAGLVLIVVVASLVPAGDLPHLGLTDKLEHMIAYGGLALWFGGLLAPRRYWRLRLHRVSWASVAKPIGAISMRTPWVPRSGCRCAWRGSVIGPAGLNDG